MANAIALYDTIPANVFGNGPLYVYQGVYDGTTGLELYRTPATGNRIFVSKIVVLDDTAGTINLGSANTTILPLLLPVNKELGFHSPIGGLIFNSKPSEALKIGTTMALTLLVFCFEGKSLLRNGTSI